jgi:hypothetical protein
MDLGVWGISGRIRRRFLFPIPSRNPSTVTSGYVSGLRSASAPVPERLGVHINTPTPEPSCGRPVRGQLGVSPRVGLGVLREAGRISSSLTWDYTGSSVEQTFTEVDGWSVYRTPLPGDGAGVLRGRQGLQDLSEGKNLANATPAVTSTSARCRSAVIRAQQQPGQGHTGVWPQLWLD